LRTESHLAINEQTIFAFIPDPSGRTAGSLTKQKKRSTAGPIRGERSLPDLRHHLPSLPNAMKRCFLLVACARLCEGLREWVAMEVV
jgi:hypothetical protein